MRTLKKKKLDELLPVNKPPQKAQDKSKSGAEPIEKNKKETTGPQELERMKKRLALTGHPEERKKILDSIQEKYGNDTAGQIIDELRLQKDEEENE